MREDSRLLRREIGIHEGILTAAVPKIENQVAKESDMVLLDINGSPKASGQRRRIIRTKIPVSIVRIPLTTTPTISENA